MVEEPGHRRSRRRDLLAPAGVAANGITAALFSVVRVPRPYHPAPPVDVGDDWKLPREFVGDGEWRKRPVDHSWRKLMQLLLRRDQRSGLLGKIVFVLDVRADISDDERANIRKYRLGETELYASHAIIGGSGLIGIATRLAWKAVTLTITVDDLATGKRVEARDIVEMLAIEENIREAAKTFKQVLDAAAHFGGEEVIEI